MKIAGKTITYNSKEFNVLFERIFPSMYLLAAKLLGSEEKGKDIAQEAFVKLWERDVEDFESEKALTAYLYVLVKNASISYLRKKSNKDHLSLDEGLQIPNQEFYNEILRQETYKLLHTAIKDLSPQAQQVVNLTLHGYKNQDIAIELNITVNTVKTVKRRAYKVLRQKLGNQFVAILLGSFFEFF